MTFPSTGGHDIVSGFPLCFGIGLIESKPLFVLEALYAWTIWEAKTALGK
jgi:hypothetical protein